VIGLGSKPSIKFSPLLHEEEALRRGPEDVIARLARGESVDPVVYYLSTNPYFGTSPEKFSWFIASARTATGSVATGEPIADLHEVV
jgi:hypothetical protein